MSSRCRCCDAILPTAQLSHKKCHFDKSDDVVVLDEFEDMCGDCIGYSYQTYSILNKEYAFEGLSDGIKSPCRSSL